MKRLLVIDDDPKVTAVFAEFFAGRYLVDTASTGVEGLAAFERNRPDAVFLDISMPEMNGLQVLRRMKDLDERIPVIMVTGNSEVTIAEAALRDGAFAYLPKPFQLQYADHLIAAAISEPSAR